MMKNIIKQLHQGNFSCVVEKQGVIRTFTRPGVVDLYELLKKNADFLKDASMADKVVGKAAAALMIQGRVKRVYTDLISQSALNILRKAEIEVLYAENVPFIKNRDRSDWCPLEKKCASENSTKALLPIIELFIKNVRT